MPFRNKAGKHAEEALADPATHIAWWRERGRLDGFRCPRGVVLVYDVALYRSLLARDDARPAGGDVLRGLRLVGDGTFGFVGGFGIGAPATVVVVEELAALGVQQFVSIGSAGGVASDVAVGDLVVCTGAVRDEGVSHHYLPAEEEPLPDAALTKTLGAEIERRLGGSVRSGLSWTIDAPYRETAAEVSHYQDAGVLTVEMEASALFAVAEVRGFRVAAAFCISDMLCAGEWDPQFDAPQVRSGLQLLFDSALACLAAA